LKRLAEWNKAPDRNGKGRPVIKLRSGPVFIVEKLGIHDLYSVEADTTPPTYCGRFTGLELVHFLLDQDAASKDPAGAKE
jgi:hypothetical protein